MHRDEIKVLNDLISHHGSLQVSPHNLKQLGRTGTKPFIPRGQHQPPNTGYIFWELKEIKSVLYKKALARRMSVMTDAGKAL